MTESAEIVVSTKDYLFATWQHLMLAVWRGHTTMDGVREGQRVFHEHIKNHPGGVLLLTVVEDGAPMPDADARNELGKLLQSGAGHTKKSAVVYEGEGFRAAAVRSVVTGILVFSKPPFPHKVFARVAEAAGFLASEGGQITGKQLADLVHDVRERSKKALASTG